jgi:sugar lactone lactonase YvrE
MQTLMDGLQFVESPRWHEGRLWFSDLGAGRVYSVAGDGTSRVEAEVASFPMCIDFLSDGRLLVVSSADRQVLRREPDSTLVTHAELAANSTKPRNDIVVDGRGNAYVDRIGFNFPGGDFAPGHVVLITAHGTVTQVADGLAFPNGMLENQTFSATGDIVSDTAHEQARLPGPRSVRQRHPARRSSDR